jgi:diguanylate cyclase (GGDEF)-like protein/PAS domain S-box-containing protein
MFFVITIFCLQFLYSSQVLQELNEEKVESSMTLISTEVSKWLDSKQTIIDDSERFIRIVNDEEKILSYLEEKLSNNSELNSIYYLSTDNRMINATGWTPAPGQDMRTRLWYQEAISNDSLIFTEAFLNASENDMIVSIAKPVYNEDRQIQGVVSADLSLQVLNRILAQNTAIPQALSFLVDGDGFVIASSDPDRIVFQDQMSYSGGLSFEKNTLAGNTGFLSSTFIANQNWQLLFFVPSEYMLQPANTLQGFLIVTLIIFLAIMLVYIFLQKKMIAEPLAAFEKNISDEIRAERSNFESLFKNSSDAIAIVDRENRVMEINEKFTQLFKYTLEEIKGIDIDLLIATEEKMEEARSFTELLFKDKVDSVETIRFDKDKNPKEVEVKGIPILLDGEVVGGYGSYTDISRRKAAEREILWISYHDQLTGLYNRRYFETRVREIDQSENLPISVVMADLNGLKLANDAFGHATGDGLLVKTGEIISAHLKENDFVARIGGDEFIVVLLNADDDDAREFVGRVRSSISENHGDNIDLSVSFGWDTKTKQEQSIHDVINKAENYMYKRKLSEGPSMISNTIKIIINTLHEKNEREKQHSDRVSRICMEIGKAMGFDQEQLSVLNLVGLVHDIGKIGIDENILNKAGPLTEAEHEEIKKHPQIGYRILSSTNEMSDLAFYTLCHHERWDGKGYPKGIKGLQIPLVSRIIAVADAYDAMTSERPYREPQSVQSAVSELQEFSGTQFDPDVVDVFVEKVLKDYL